MSNMDDRLNKLREERIAREQARIQKLRELNLKKYPKSELELSIRNNQTSNSKVVKLRTVSQKNVTQTTTKNVLPINGIKNVKNNILVNGTSKRPITAPVPQKVDYSNVKPKVVTKVDSDPNNVKMIPRLHNCARTVKDKKAIPVASTSNLVKRTFATIVKNSNEELKDKPFTSTCKTISTDENTLIADKATKDDENKKSDLSQVDNKVLTEINNPTKVTKDAAKSRNSIVPPTRIKFDKPNITRKSMPQAVENSKSESVFERLYKPKYITNKPVNTVDKLQKDPNYMKKLMKNADLIVNKHHTVFDKKPLEKNFPPRRSISAVHFKRMGKNEVGNCIHKWASIGDQLNKGDVEMNEDEQVKEEKIVSAIKSERKKVQFMTPIPSNFNTPRPDELQAKLESWLQKRGKSLQSYQHLHCFGLHHLKSDLSTPKSILFDDSIQVASKEFDEENKENIALESDSDNESYADTMDMPCAVDKIDTVNWRNASIDSESVGFNESKNCNESSIASSDHLTNVEELLIGALNDLTALLREGFDWQQAARWLRSIRSRFPSAPKNAAYWECRAALEDSRGDLPASLQCWEQAIAKGTEHSVVDSNLDHLLVKFMQLKISPQSGAPRQPDPKLVDVKNVFKSTIIRFAVQQAKLRRQSEQPSFTVTPVRRSARLSHCPPRTPLQLFENMQQATKNAPKHVFKPNDNFVHTP